MRNFPMCFLLTVVLAFSGMLYAQEEEPHVYVLSTFELLSPEGGSSAEFDSLGALWYDRIVKNNEFIVSEITMRHLYGSNANDFVVLDKYKSFCDIEKASSRNSELMKEAWPEKEERQKFWKAFVKYFGNHSDEIYQED